MKTQPKWLSTITNIPLAIRKWFYNKHVIVLAIYVFVMFNTFCSLIRMQSDVAVVVALFIMAAIIDVVWFKLKALSYKL